MYDTFVSGIPRIWRKKSTVSGPFETGTPKTLGSFEEDIIESGKEETDRKHVRHHIVALDKNQLDSVENNEKQKYCTLQTALFVCRYTAEQNKRDNYCMERCSHESRWRRQSDGILLFFFLGSYSNMVV
jgi:hypothetical protein